jgi:hypothetical protein
MPKFYVYIVGKGEGCDYTISCNETLEELNADTRERAIAEVKDDFMESGGRHGDIAYERMILVSHEKELPVGMWMREVEEGQAQEEAEEERRRDEAEFERLRKKLGK